MEISATKEKIMSRAILLFSERGYDNVSVRDIAAAAGIKAASIYNHFPSKNDILKSIYEFYASEHQKVIPPLEELYRQLETEPVQDILIKLGNYWPPYAQDRMDRIILIANQRICIDKTSENFIKEHFFKPVTRMLIPLLNRAIKSGKIEPVDVEAFTRLAAHYAYSAVDLNPTTMKLNIKQWNSGLLLLMSLLKPAEPGSGQSDKDNPYGNDTEK